MSRTIQLSKNLTRDIHDTCQHYIDNTDKLLSQDYEELRDMTHGNDRFKLTVTLEERIPHCQDLVVNMMVKYILEVVDCNEDDTEEMNAFYDYVTWKYAQVGFFDGDAFLLKATTTEALEYVVNWIVGGCMTITATGELKGVSIL
jgi:hypothetical protein